jgi:ABC-2 type transport system ATP-binding protein
MNAVAGFLGPNGAGKTTTLRLILGLLPAKNGNIELLGHEIPRDRTAALEKIGAVVENPSFIETMTAFENLSWFGYLYYPVKKTRIHEVIELVGLKEATNQNFGTFSTGMKQRLGVAFGLLHKPELLILDEPTSGMDPTGRFQMREILLNIHEKEKTSIFLSSHLLDEVQKLCNYVVIINKGRTITEGYVADILSSNEERYEIRVADDEIEKVKSILEDTKSLVKSITLAPRGFIVDLENDTSSAINEILVKKGIKVQALIPLERSLEETFMKLTDKSFSAEKVVKVESDASQDSKKEEA